MTRDIPERYDDMGNQRNQMKVYELQSKYQRLTMEKDVRSSRSRSTSTSTSTSTNTSTSTSSRAAVAVAELSILCLWFLLLSFPFFQIYFVGEGGSSSFFV